RRSWQALRFRAGDPPVEIGVAASRCIPAEIARHGGLLQRAPARPVAPRRERTPRRGYERAAFGTLQQESRAAVDDRAGRSAGGARAGRRAVALAVHLVEAAGLEARGHEESVRARLDQVGKILVEADPDREPPRCARGQVEQRLLVLARAG